MKFVLFPALLFAPPGLWSAPSPAPFAETLPPLPPLSLQDSLAQPPDALHEPSAPVAPRGRRSRGALRRAPATRHTLRVLEPDPAVDFKLLIQPPDDRVAYSMRLQEVPPPPQHRAPVEDAPRR